jgi:hypothetical protein
MRRLQFRVPGVNAGGAHCRLSLREWTSFRGAKGDTKYHREAHSLNHTLRRENKLTKDLTGLIVEAHSTALTRKLVNGFAIGIGFGVWLAC